VVNEAENFYCAIRKKEKERQTEDKRKWDKDKNKWALVRNKILLKTFGTLL
jgi:hypothetical protein